MATTLFSRNARNYTDTTFEISAIQLSSVVNLGTLWKIQARIEIISGAGQVVITYRLSNPSGIPTTTTSIFDRPGKHIVGLMRKDLDAATTFSATIQVVGTVRASVEVIAYARGEDIPEWL